MESVSSRLRRQPQCHFLTPYAPAVSTDWTVTITSLTNQPHEKPATVTYTSIKYVIFAKVRQTRTQASGIEQTLTSPSC